MSSPLSGHDTIDKLLVYCQRNDIARTKKGDVQVGRFLFKVSAHSTGNSIYGYILDGDDSYCFLNCTWWFSSAYTFNDSNWEHGAWDHELEDAFDRLRQLVAEHKQKLEEERLAKIADTDRAAAERKAKFEQLFK